MKANHNVSIDRLSTVMLLQISVVQRMKANHNVRQVFDHIDQLLQISVVQRMKANHNALPDAGIIARVVANISCSKNESKSQQTSSISAIRHCCCKYQLFKE